jgi:hypothetical protein
MRRLLLLLVLVVAVVVGVGFYQGWFRLATDQQDGQADISVTVDKDKLEQDKARASQKVQDLGHKNKAATDGGTERAARP